MSMPEASGHMLPQTRNGPHLRAVSNLRFSVVTEPVRARQEPEQQARPGPERRRQAPEQPDRQGPQAPSRQAPEQPDRREPQGPWRQEPALRVRVVVVAGSVGAVTVSEPGAKTK